MVCRAPAVSLSSLVQVQTTSLPCGCYNNMLNVSLIDWIPEPNWLDLQIKKIKLNITLGGVHGVWDNQAGSQRWLPTPNASDRLNSDSPSRRD